MMLRELPKQTPKSYIIKYDYEDCTETGAIIVHALTPDMAVLVFRKYMFDKKDARWNDHAYRRSDFRFVSKNIFGWHQYFNDDATICIKVREIDMKFGDVIPVQEYFEDAKIDHLM